MKHTPIWNTLLIILAALGIADTAYLTYERLSNKIIPCATGYFVDCGKVLESAYSQVAGIPLTSIGLVHYSLLCIFILLAIVHKHSIWKNIIFIQTLGGLIASFYFVFLQLFVIQAICLYCMVSAIDSFILFFVSRKAFSQDYRNYYLWFFALIYQFILKKLLFLFDPEKVHNAMTHGGEVVFKNKLVRNLVALILRANSPQISQILQGVPFNSPVGLSAGFDYEARLTHVLPALGFGFGTVGTITNLPYEGNALPRLGRLPKSKSLMVNKGFKNEGADSVIQKLKHTPFQIPIGISIGRTNTDTFKTQQDAIDDIVQAFLKFEKSAVDHTYYELNISCPNLKGGITFYPPNNLKQLLERIEKLRIKRPIFIKMPIEKSDEEVLAMLKIIEQFSVAGVIFGNLQKDRTCKQLDPEEVKKWSMGNFSGKPTERRSNELIKLTYQTYAKRFIIIGCGGIFTAHDAYTKIKLGASVVQLITGMIYNGPQLIAQINNQLPQLLAKDGYSHISEAVGVSAKSSDCCHCISKSKHIQS